MKTPAGAPMSPDSLTTTLPETFLTYVDLAREPLRKVCHMRDHANHSISLLQRLQCVDRHVEVSASRVEKPSSRNKASSWRMLKSALNSEMLAVSASARARDARNDSPTRSKRVLLSH